MYRGFSRGHQYTLWQKEKDPETTEWGKLLTKSMFSGTIFLQVWRKKYNA